MTHSLGLSVSNLISDLSNFEDELFSFFSKICDLKESLNGRHLLQHTEGQHGALSWLAVPATVTPPLRQRRRNNPNPQPQESLTGEGVTCRYP